MSYWCSCVLFAPKYATSSRYLHDPATSSAHAMHITESTMMWVLLQRSSTTVEDDDQAEPSEPTQEVSAQGPPLVVRLELYERLRQSRATPQDLFPAKLLQVSAPAIPLLGRRSGFDAPASRTITFSAGSAIPRKVERVPPPGLFHQFVRHVRPFSLCPDSGSTGTRLEDTLPSSHHQADHLAPPEPTGGAGFKARMTPTGNPPTKGRHNTAPPQRHHGVTTSDSMDTQRPRDKKTGPLLESGIQNSDEVAPVVCVSGQAGASIAASSLFLLWQNLLAVGAM